MHPLLANPAEIPALLHRVRAEIYRRSFYDFSKSAWNVMHPGTPFIEGWHYGAICEHLQAVAHGQIRRLIINGPPRIAKSYFTSVFLPAWIWTWWPEFRGLFTAWDGQLASRDSMRCRTLIKSDWYKGTFNPDWTLTADQDEKTYYENTKSGIRQAFGVAAGGTGFGGDGMVVDDPQSAKQARSKKLRANVLTWWDETMSTRVNDFKTAFRIIQQQRLHKNDLSGEMLARGGYIHLNLPLEYDPKRSCVTVYKDADGKDKYWEDPRTELGEVLCKYRFTPEVIEALKKELGGTRAYGAQANQDPKAVEGKIFKRTDWRFWKPDGKAPTEKIPRPKGCYAGPARAIPEKFDEIILSVDCTFKDKEDSDYVVILVVGRKGQDRFLLERLRKQWSFSQTCVALIDVCKRWPKARKKIIEDTANGPAIISRFKSKIAGLIPRNPEGSKEERAELAAPHVESGNWYLPEGAPWLEEFISEHEDFPDGNNDDQVDAMTQADAEFSRGDSLRLQALLSSVRLKE